MEQQSASSAWTAPTALPQDAAHLLFFRDFEAYPFSDDPEFKAGLPTVIQTIRGTKRTPGEIDEMIGRAQWFYFTRQQGVSIPWESYAQYTRLRSQNASCPAPAPEPALALPASSSGPLATTTSTESDRPGGQSHLAEARRVMVQDAVAATGAPIQAAKGDGGAQNDESTSFTLLCQLISEGRAGEIPGVRHIPDEINSEPPSVSTMSARPKPWESQQQSVINSSSFIDNLTVSNHVWDMGPLGNDLEQETAIPSQPMEPAQANLS